MWGLLKLLFVLSVTANVVGTLMGIDMLEGLWGVSGLLGVQCYRRWMGMGVENQNRDRGFRGQPPIYHHV